MPMLIFNLFPSDMACLIRLTDLSPRNAPPAGINDGFLTAATSQISALFIPLDFIASRSLVIDVSDIFPFSQHQKAPGRYDMGGLRNSSDRFWMLLIFFLDLLFCSVEIKQADINRFNTINIFRHIIISY